jgi:hypothetical protein
MAAMRAMAFALVALTVGCTHVQYGGNVNGATVHVNTGNALGVVLLGGMLTAAAAEDFREPQMYPALSNPSLADWIWSPPPPAMSPDRPVAQQDCTKPIELTGNLRCK